MISSTVISLFQLCVGIAIIYTAVLTKRRRKEMPKDFPLVPPAVFMLGLIAVGNLVGVLGFVGRPVQSETDYWTVVVLSFAIVLIIAAIGCVYARTWLRVPIHSNKKS